jgi:hypothetical protein
LKIRLRLLLSNIIAWNKNLDEGGKTELPKEERRTLLPLFGIKNVTKYGRLVEIPGDVRLYLCAVKHRLMYMWRRVKEWR